MNVLEKAAELLQRYSEEVMDLTHKLDQMVVITNDDKARRGIIKHDLYTAQAKKDVLEELMDGVNIE